MWNRALAVMEVWAQMEVRAVALEVTEAAADAVVSFVFVVAETTLDHDLVNVDVAEMSTAAAVFVFDISSCSSDLVATFAAAAAVEVFAVADDDHHGEELQQREGIAYLSLILK